MACLLAIFSLSCLAFAIPVAKARAELHCRIIPDPVDEGYKPWHVELRKSSGEPLLATRSASGKTLRFEDLEPGIYVLCLTGDKGRNRCKSMDLTLPPGTAFQKFEREIEAPPPHMRRSDLFKIELWRLGITDEARREFGLAQKARLGNDPEGYVAHLARAVEIYPQYLAAWNNLGAHYHLAGDYAKAAECFVKVTTLDPDSYAGWANLGGSLLMTLDYEEALEASRRALDLRPNAALAHSNAGLAHYYMRDYDLAKPYFEKVRSIDPGFANSPDLFLAHIAFAQERLKDGVEHMQGFLKFHPNSPKAPYVRTTIRSLMETIGQNASAGRSPNSNP